MRPHLKTWPMPLPSAPPLRAPLARREERSARERTVGAHRVAGTDDASKKAIEQSGCVLLGSGKEQANDVCGEAKTGGFRGQRRIRHARALRRGRHRGAGDRYEQCKRLKLLLHALDGLRMELALAEVHALFELVESLVVSAHSIEADRKSTRLNSSHVALSRM